jgi:hypothetical protein
MTKGGNKAILVAGRLLAVRAIILTLTFISQRAAAEVNYALMLQQTPVNGGTVSPEIGVHAVLANGNVAITATPKAGYQFVYWLGDVAEPTANSTVVSVDAPKIVVAVFERSEYELPFLTPSPPDSIGGGGSLSSNRQYIGGGGGVSPASGPATIKGPTYVFQQAPNEQNNQNNPPPVPEVPEPATVLLLGVGSLLALKIKK